MNLLDRIGVDIGGRMPVEQAIEAAASRRLKFIDVQLDVETNKVDLFDEVRTSRIRDRLRETGLEMGLHTLSAVNVAEFSPFLTEAVDNYLKAYVDVSSKLGARHVVVHAGYHFTSDKTRRMHAGLQRLEMIAEYAEQRKVRLLLENMNKEPDDAEVHYLAHSIEEWQFYFDRIRSPRFGLAFTANHAHIMPDGVDGFLDAIDIARVGEIRLADCWRNGIEEHLDIGDGDLDFGNLFKKAESRGYKGYYVNAFVSLDAMVAARERLVSRATSA